ncbi:MAG: endonuclease MutS2 [Ignavibacteriae bacterium]|nr:endonuclease MutS2 [Ignavibacteriota bacterium]
MSSAVSPQRPFAAALQKLEFDKVLDRVARLTSSEPGRAQATSAYPLTDITAINEELKRVSEAKELLIAEGTIPIDGVKNISPALQKTRVENHILTAVELLDVASTLKTARVMHGFLTKRKSIYPHLAVFLPRLFYEKVVEYNIENAIDESGSIRDTASKELKRIRQDIIASEESLRRQLTAIVRRVSEQEFAQEEIVTTRDGRLVIPIKAEHKKHVPGFVHTSSASGATVYIEPAECLELNNSLRELHLQEFREIEKILRDLTRQVQEIQEPLELSLQTLALIDVIVAKAKYSIEILGNAPLVSAESRRVRLVQARHPVLLQRHGREEVVPLDVELGTDGVVTLIITGPNAGGKSVAMKTVGILALCAQAGLHIPASPESELPLFENVFVDIGDDQSIENDLSTFSSHLVRLKDIVTGANSTSLVLIDEIGAGTDPAEGAALGAAILDELTKRRAMTIATTHHGALKAFAHETPGMANGSLEFDQATLSPTYRFRFGVPGSSYALELAERLAIPPGVLIEARKHMGEEKTKLESLLAELESQMQEQRRQSQLVSGERSELQRLIDSYEAKLAEVKRDAASVRKKAVEEAQALIQKAQSTIERTVKEIREQGADKKRIQSAREEVTLLQTEIAGLHQATPETIEDETFAVGDSVRLRDGSEVGEITELRGKEAVVVWSNGKLRVPIAKLVKDKKSAGSVISYQTDSNYEPQAAPEVDLRGMLGDEAIEKVQRVLDDAIVSGLHRVDIIHGKGTGALRKKVTEFLKGYPHVKAFRLGEWNEGGSGVTVVELG